MSIVKCGFCDKNIDTDFNLEHFDEMGICLLELEHDNKMSNNMNHDTQPISDLMDKSIEGLKETLIKPKDMTDKRKCPFCFTEVDDSELKRIHGIESGVYIGGFCNASNYTKNALGHTE